MSLGFMLPSSSGGGDVFGGGSSGSGFDWSNVINQGFAFGQTFLQAKYAKDASKYAGGYYPQGQGAGGGGAAPYQQIAPTSQQNTTVSNTAGNFAASFTRFIENNIGILAIGGIFLFAWQRQPKRS